VYITYRRVKILPRVSGQELNTEPCRPANRLATPHSKLSTPHSKLSSAHHNFFFFAFAFIFLPFHHVNQIKKLIDTVQNCMAFFLLVVFLKDVDNVDAGAKSPPGLECGELGGMGEGITLSPVNEYLQRKALITTVQQVINK
jgi:hypothetical protein